MVFVYIIAALVAGIALGYFFKSSQAGASVARAEFDGVLKQLADKENQLSALQATLEHKVALLQKTEHELSEKETLLLETSASNSSAQKEISLLREQLEQQKKDVEKLKDELQKDFKLIAQNILKEKSEEFEKQNNSQLDNVLKPFKEKIEDFKKQFEDNKNQQTKDQATLLQQIKNLTELNNLMRDEANKLTTALEGSKKTQGNWGELILERVLEMSGLKKEFEYEVQVSATAEDGSRFQPDVVIHLPDNKDLVIDSKVSLNSYVACTHAETEDEAKIHLKTFLQALRTHIKSLGEKNYAQLQGIKAPDFVFMFIPIEGAFQLALQNDQEIYQYGYDRRIIIVSPTTLLASLKTVSYIWNNEKKNRNFDEVNRLVQSLYEKVTGFIEEYIEIGKRLNKVTENYQANGRRLYEGNGNIVITAEKIRKLGGVNPGKRINDAIVGLAEQQDLLSEKKNDE